MGDASQGKCRSLEEDIRRLGAEQAGAVRDLEERTCALLNGINDFFWRFFPSPLSSIPPPPPELVVISCSVINKYIQRATWSKCI